MRNVLVIGSVKTTKHTIIQLVKNDFNVVGILGHEPKDPNLVSGWTNLRELANEYQLDYRGFSKVNDSEHIKWAASKDIDIIFAVGFSQLMSVEWLQMPKLGCIGFHPSFLPRGRGRAPIAWMILEKSYGSATFFLMGEGADDGPVFVQEIFKVEDSDDASSVENKIEVAINNALERWLPQLKNDIWEPVPQDELKATLTGKRSMEDGIINWNDSAYQIDRLIKASTKPHPGAYTYYKDAKMIIWKSELEKQLPIKGVVGRILIKDKDKGFLVQCGEGLIWLRDISLNEITEPVVGSKLGYNVEDEIFILKHTLKKISDIG